MTDEDTGHEEWIKSIYEKLDDAKRVVPFNWKPLCFDEHSHADDKFCRGVRQTNWMGYVQPELEENCVDCPYRLKVESK